MAKRNVSEIETGAGFFMGFVNATMDVVREKAIPFAAVYRLATAGGRKTLGSMIDLAYSDWQAEQPQRLEVGEPQDGHLYRDAPTNGDALPPDHYRVRVTYAPMPSMDALKKEWGEGNVSVIFDDRSFTLHTSCQGMDRTPGERTFYVHDLGCNWEGDEQIVWGLKQRNAVAPRGYRPAIREEVYEFAKAHPELVDFVGLGSFAVGGGRRYVASVWRYGGQRVLDDGWFGCGWDRRGRVLFVRK